MKSPRLLPALLLATFALLGLPGSALAQSGSMSMSIYNDEASFRPDLSSADLKVVERVLGLDAAEKQALEVLYSGYAATLKNEGGEVRDFVNGEIERAQAMQDVRLLDKAHKKISDWEAHSEKVKKAFLEDLKSLLSKDQEARWPIVERELRRIKLIGGGRLSGESVDLVRLTDDCLGTEPTGDLADLLNRYSGELDHAIQARTEFLADKRHAFNELISSNPAAAKSIWDDSQRIRGFVRDMNERYAKLICDALPAEKRDSFQKQVFTSSYPVIAKPSTVETYLKDATDLGTLTGAQRSQIAAIKGRYDADRATIMARGAIAWRQYESEDKPQALAEALGERPKDQSNQLYTGAWLPDTHPLIKYRRERFALEQALRASLDAVLNPEQKGAIPGRYSPYAMFENWEPWGL